MNSAKLSSSTAKNFENGILLAKLLNFYLIETKSTDPKITGLQKGCSRGAKNYNWALLRDYLERLGLISNFDTFPLVVAGDTALIEEIFEAVRRVFPRSVKTHRTMKRRSGSRAARPADAAPAAQSNAPADEKHVHHHGRRSRSKTRHSRGAGAAQLSSAPSNATRQRAPRGMRGFSEQLKRMHLKGITNEALNSARCSTTTSRGVVPLFGEIFAHRLEVPPACAHALLSTPALVETMYTRPHLEFARAAAEFARDNAGDKDFARLAEMPQNAASVLGAVWRDLEEKAQNVAFQAHSAGHRAVALVLNHACFAVARGSDEFGLSAMRFLARFLSTIRTGKEGVEIMKGWLFGGPRDSSGLMQVARLFGVRQLRPRLLSFLKTFGFLRCANHLLSYDIADDPFKTALPLVTLRLPSVRVAPGWSPVKPSEFPYLKSVFKVSVAFAVENARAGSDCARSAFEFATALVFSFFDVWPGMVPRFIRACQELCTVDADAHLFELHGRCALALFELVKFLLARDSPHAIAAWLVLSASAPLAALKAGQAEGRSGALYSFVLCACAALMLEFPALPFGHLLKLASSVEAAAFSTNAAELREDQDEFQFLAPSRAIVFFANAVCSALVATGQPVAPTLPLVRQLLAAPSTSSIECKTSLPQPPSFTPPTAATAFAWIVERLDEKIFFSTSARQKEADGFLVGLALLRLCAAQEPARAIAIVEDTRAELLARIAEPPSAVRAENVPRARFRFSFTLARLLQAEQFFGAVPSAEIELRAADGLDREVRELFLEFAAEPFRPNRDELVAVAQGLRQAAARTEPTLSPKTATDARLVRGSARMFRAVTQKRSFSASPRSHPLSSPGASDLEPISETHEKFRRETFAELERAFMEYEHVRARTVREMRTGLPPGASSALRANIRLKARLRDQAAKRYRLITSGPDLAVPGAIARTRLTLQQTRRLRALHEEKRKLSTTLSQLNARHSFLKEQTQLGKDVPRFDRLDMKRRMVLGRISKLEKEILEIEKTQEGPLDMITE
eukprot:gnl/Chilomastix_cuspidata/3515.p1 GENE.gnl/Chilomastix_cuspidata/3515~~gnl/Chilomastix_cuspidata/3515.p1  ORF type:complete len:1066 (+),score=345.01 gnl/Chilomastix_cuspidata/3515:121-3198(+)